MNQCDVGNQIKRFMVDHMLGKMAKWLRILGFDTIYRHIETRGHLLESRREGRWVVTRNRRWRGSPRVIWVSCNSPREQVQELIQYLRIGPQEVQLFSRCLRCNEILKPVDRMEARGRVPDYVWATHQHFHQCPGCGRVYWPGTHAERMRRQVLERFGWKAEKERKGGHDGRFGESSGEDV